MIKTYSELMSLKTFKDRFDYACVNGIVGKETYGFDRWINQAFYASKDWKRIRDFVIVRDNGCDLGFEDRPINGRIIVHHLNPISEEDIENNTRFLMDPEMLICVSHITHEAIHYGDYGLLIKDYIPRKKYDTCPWR